MKEYLNFEPNLLLSIINMKLRDFYLSLEDLCEYLNVDQKKLEQKLSSINYIYNKENNQFVYKKE